MFRPLDAILQPDPRYESMVMIDPVTAVTRKMEVADLYEIVSPLQLGNHVPKDIREQFDKARNAFLYSFFAYDLSSVAEQQTYAVVEMALRERLGIDPTLTRRKPGLKELIRQTIDRGHLSRADFDRGPINILDVLPLMRNELAHGSLHLMPFATPSTLQLGFDIINKLFV